MKLTFFFALVLLSTPAFATVADATDVSDVTETQKKPQHPIAPLIFGATAVSVMFYEFGKEEPEAVRDYFLLGSVAVAFVPREARRLRPHLLPLTLGMAAMNDHYERHPEKRDDAAGWANVAALWGGSALVALSLVLTEKNVKKPPEAAALPFVLKDGGGLTYSRAF